MSVPDPRMAQSGPTAVPSRFPGGGLAMAIVTAALALLGSVGLLIRLEFPNFLSFRTPGYDATGLGNILLSNNTWFPYATQTSVVFLVACVVGTVLVVVPPTRRLGYGFLLPTGSLLAFLWSGASSFWYGDILFSVPVPNNLRLFCVASFLVALTLSVVAGIGILGSPKAKSQPFGRSLAARLLLVCATLAALGFVWWEDLRYSHSAFYTFQPFGFALDVLGAVVVPLTFLWLAVRLPRASTIAVAVSVWVVLEFLVFFFASRYSGGNWFYDFTSGVPSDVLPYVWVAVVALFGYVAVGVCPKGIDAPGIVGAPVGFIPPRCAQGHMIPAGFAACTYCAPVVLPVPAGPEGFGRVCPIGHTVPPGDLFCGECGVRV